MGTVTARQAVELAVALTCATATTLAGLVAAIFTPTDDPRDTEEDL